ncbi:MAG: hypothetical protein C0603_09580 [Denitrovibrio sp.]|nr:MAG: hypothetical protein C0603_09580 [Denitrovibrio sp.]
MIYPYFLLNYDKKVSKITNQEGYPLNIVLDDDLASKAIELSGDSVKINDLFNNIIANSGYSWATGSYLEDRESILSQYEQMSIDKRYFHLGIDICLPAGEPIYAPLDATVEETGYEKGEGNYGGYVVLKHEIEDVEPFYVMFGHMSLDSLPKTGERLVSGDVVARIGDLHENGGWNHHTHIQIITEEGRKQGYFFKGYCSEKDLKIIDSLCPSPVPLLTAGR